MTRFIGFWLLTSALLMASLSAQAQPGAKIPRIGFLSSFSPGTFSARIDAFRKGLSELGYEEGKNIAVEYRYAEGQLDRLPKLAAELVNLKVDVIVTHSDTAIRALKQATQSIPIVVGVTGDLVVSGHAASLARPGGNITGFVDTSPDLSGKRLEILKEVQPKATRIGVVWNGANRIKVLDFEETETAARALGLKLESLDIQGPAPVETKLPAAAKQRATAMIVLQDALTVSNAKKIVDFARTSRLPAMYGSTEFVEVGGLMSYAANFPDLFRRSAVYVDKILKGAKVGELPVQQPTKFDFVIDLKAAKQIGLTIPPNVLVRADRVIR